MCLVFVFVFVGMIFSVIQACKSVSTCLRPTTPFYVVVGRGGVSAQSYTSLSCFVFNLGCSEQLHNARFRSRAVPSGLAFVCRP